MSDLVTHAQLVLLARTLHVPVERIAYLERLGDEHLHELVQRFSARIYEYHGEMFKRIGRLIPIIPLRISLPLVQRVVPPMMTGRAAGAVGVDYPDAAAETLTMLKTEYAADCTPYVDPRALGELGDIMASDPLVAILNEILARKDYVTAGPFLEFASPRLVEAIEAGVRDDVGIIFSAANAYSAPAVSRILRQLLGGRFQRIPRMVQTVLEGSTELQYAAISVFGRCEPDVIAGIGDIIFSVGTPEGIRDFLVNVIRMGAVAEVMTFTGHLSLSALGTMAMNPLFADTVVFPALVSGVGAQDRADPWRGLLALAERSPDRQQHIVELISRLPAESLTALPSIATEGDLWQLLLRILAAGARESQYRIGTVWATLSPERRAGVHRRIAELRLEQSLPGIVEQVPEVSVEEVFYQRRRRLRHRFTPADSW